MEDTALQIQDSAKIVTRQADVLSGAGPEAEVISGIGTESSPKGSKGVNTKPIVGLCAVVVAVILLITFCVLGHRQQSKRDKVAGRTKKENDEERRIPPVGIVG
jgi:hypothetical protein